MRKAISLILLTISLLFAVSCSNTNYKEYAGTYELYYSLNSDINYYEYYYIVVNDDGSTKVEYKVVNTGEIVIIDEYKIEVSGDEFNFVKYGFLSKETLIASYENGEISMVTNLFDGNIKGAVFYKFRKINN